MGAENSTYIRSRLRGTSAEVGQMPSTSVVAARVGSGRTRTTASAPPTLTAYAVPATNGKRGTKHRSPPSRTRCPAIGGSPAAPAPAPAPTAGVRSGAAGTGRTCTAVSPAKPPRRTQSAPPQSDHDTSAIDGPADAGR